MLHRYGEPSKTFAIGLGCELRHAGRTVYADGLDLNEPKATPIGAGCRVCERSNCPQRAFPPLQHGFTIDENVRGASFYAPAMPPNLPIAKKKRSIRASTPKSESRRQD